MAGRKLSRRQKWRQDKVQEERLARAERKVAQFQGSGDERPGRVVQRHHATAEVLPLDQEASPTRLCHIKPSVDNLACGDRVAFVEQGDDRLIVGRQPRDSELSRPAAHGKTKVMAANLDQLMIVGALSPEPGPDTIDRFVIAAQLTGIEPVIVINKTDLIAEAPELASLRNDLVKTYTDLGHRVIETSVVDAGGLDALETALRGRTSALVGQSGVGKSTLVNALLPEAEQRTGELDDRGLGKHTTSQARLYTLTDGWLIDSPGIRAFGLSDLHRDDILVGFHDVAEAAESCRFRDCKHDSEPHCGVRSALKAKTLSAYRYANYLALAAEAQAPKFARKKREKS